MPQSLPWNELEELLHRDPGRRGLAGFRVGGRPLDAGELEAASVSLAEKAASVAIVTGFCIPTADGFRAETDGPPGVLFLARALTALGIEVTLISDEYGLPLLEAGSDLWGLPRRNVLCFPFEPGGPDVPARQANDAEHCTASDAWVQEFLDSPAGRRLTHLLAIERVGPSHTPESLVAQARTGEPPGALFAAQVPPASHNVCHNMRGEPIDSRTAKTHRLFEAVTRQRPEVVTIGIGDGGNELGMGRIPWETLVQALATPPAARIVCRIATQHLIIAGVSNWGGYALAAATCHLRGRGELLRPWDAADLQRLIEHLVREARAVDGVTRRQEATVDGLPLETYLQTFDDLRSRLQQS